MAGKTSPSTGTSTYSEKARKCLPFPSPISEWQICIVIEKLRDENLCETGMDPERDRASPKLQKLSGDDLV